MLRGRCRPLIVTNAATVRLTAGLRPVSELDLCEMAVSQDRGGSAACQLLFYMYNIAISQLRCGVCINPAACPRLNFTQRK